MLNPLGRRDSAAGDAQYNGLTFICVTQAKTLLHSRELAKIGAVFVTFVVFNIANFPIDANFFSTFESRAIQTSSRTRF